MAQTQAKEVVRQLLDRLPDDCTIEDVQYHLYVIASVEQGRAELAEGEGIPHDQVRADLRRKWLRPDDVR
jgi:predicted transcriptional regulator